MKCLNLLLTVPFLTFVAPAVAEDTDGKSLMQQGAELFLKGLTEQVEPALEDLLALGDEIGPEMLDFFSQMGPALGDLMESVEDWSAYHPPERLPNGDIIMRRKQPEIPGADPDAQIDL